jgi:pimeloyl-ACP methyl ester carboxylesterase
MADTIRVGNLTLETAEPHPGGRARPPILFIHGFLATSWVYESYLRFFADRGFAGFALNLRGRNGSTMPNGGSLGGIALEDYLDDARQAAKWLTERLERPIVVGHSMGGLLGQKLAEEGMARALVLLSSAPPRGIGLMSWSLMRRQLRYVPALLRSKPVVPRFVDARQLVLNRVPAAEQQAVFARLVPDSGRAGRQLSFGSLPVDAGRVRENDCPVLVVTSDEDQFIPSRIAQRIAEKYHAPVFMTRGHGHLMLREPGWEEAAHFISDWIVRHVPG